MIYTLSYAFNDFAKLRRFAEKCRNRNSIFTAQVTVEFDSQAEAFAFQEANGIPNQGPLHERIEDIADRIVKGLEPDLRQHLRDCVVTEVTNLRGKP